MGNGLWIVSVVKWHVTRNGIPIVGNCNSRAYRSEKYARDRYQSVLESLKNHGYYLIPLDEPECGNYEGMKGRSVSDENSRYSTSYVVVYIDRNSV